VSTPELQQIEQRSSVKIEQTAKGDPTVKVTAYTHDLDKLDAAREKAVEVYKATVAAVA
jgi:hypothetical protein